LRSRDGMLLAYAPALLAAAASFAVPGAVEGARAQLLSAALAAHFLKRVLEVPTLDFISCPSSSADEDRSRAAEHPPSRSLLSQVLFVHRYSGSMPLDTAATIASSYLLSTATMIYAQHLSHDLPDPAVDLLYPGVLVFAVGLAGNFYHHYLLSRLRADAGSGGGGGDKGYKIPRGGLFGLVTCPHYLFEILAFFGFAMIAQTLYALAVATGTAAYLAGRSCATRRWYRSKFQEFPARIKALLPYVL